jgi:hypothetical protein
VLRFNGVAFPANVFKRLPRASNGVHPSGYAAANPERKSVFLELAQRWLELGSKLDAISLRGNVLLYQPRPINR